MAEDLLAAGDRLFVEEDYEGAVQEYTKALSVNPTASKVYEARANAHIRLKKYMEAADDATKAVELDPSSYKAYLRKGIASFHLEEFESAKDSFEKGAAIAPNLTTFNMWLRKCDAEIAEEQGTQTAVHVSSNGAPTAAPAAASTARTQASSTPAAAAAAAPSPPKAPAATPVSPKPAAPAAAAASTTAPNGALTVQGAKNYRYAWYQIQDRVVVDVYAKGLRKEQVQATFKEDHLTLTVHQGDAGASDMEFELDVELYGTIDASRCKCDVRSAKLEITMPKKDTHIQWGSLERSGTVAACSYGSTAQPTPAPYPTSTKTPKDWSKVEAEIKDLEKKGELEDGDQLSSFFKKIYAGGDEDSRRAMMKSFQESGGTVLSTNWKEVGSKKVECTPPEGAELKTLDD